MYCSARNQVRVTGAFPWHTTTANSPSSKDKHGCNRKAGEQNMPGRQCDAKQPCQRRRVVPTDDAQYCPQIPEAATAGIPRRSSTYCSEQRDSTLYEPIKIVCSKYYHRKGRPFRKAVHGTELASSGSTHGLRGEVEETLGRRGGRELMMREVKSTVSQHSVGIPTMPGKSHVFN